MNSDLTPSTHFGANRGVMIAADAFEENESLE
jgi:hypothetical protein